MTIKPKVRERLESGGAQTAGVRAAVTVLRSETRLQVERL